MKKWLLRQTEIYLPSFIFCALALLAFYLSPSDDIIAPPQLETQVINAKLSRVSGDGDRLFLQTETLTKRIDGVVDFENVRTQTLHGGGKVALRGPRGTLDDAGEMLVINDANGEITTDNVQATLSMQTATYHLIENRLNGTTVRWEQNGSVFFSNRFVLDEDGKIVADGGVRATFMETAVNQN